MNIIFVYSELPNAICDLFCLECW